MTSKLRFSPTFNENVKISSNQNDAEENFNYENSIWDSWPVVVEVKLGLMGFDASGENYNLISLI